MKKKRRILLVIIILVTVLGFWDFTDDKGQSEQIMSNLEDASEELIEIVHDLDSVNEDISNLKEQYAQLKRKEK